MANAAKVRFTISTFRLDIALKYPAPGESSP